MFLKMKTFFLLFFLYLGINSISAQTKVISLDPQVFFEGLKSNSNPQLIDIRTESEFETAHIKKSIHLDWSSLDLEERLLKGFSKENSIFIYCQTGKVSEGATLFLEEIGFEKIYYLKGGFENWISKSKPYVSNSKDMKPLAFLSIENFNKKVLANTFVLVDFYAVWCGPCKKMDPILEKIDLDFAKLSLFKIDAEKNVSITENYEIEEIPTLILFKNGKQIWRNTGLITEKEILEKIN
jgi:thioredoxin 1